MSRRALRDDMPGIIAAHHRARRSPEAWRRSRLNETNPLAGLAVGIASAVLEEADTRTWRTLPDNTQVARLRLKKGKHQITLPNASGGDRAQDHRSTSAIR